MNKQAYEHMVGLALRDSLSKTASPVPKIFNNKILKPVYRGMTDGWHTLATLQLLRKAKRASRERAHDVIKYMYLSKLDPAYKYIKNSDYPVSMDKMDKIFEAIPRHMRKEFPMHPFDNIYAHKATSDYIRFAAKHIRNAEQINSRLSGLLGIGAGATGMYTVNKLTDNE